MDAQKTVEDIADTWICAWGKNWEFSTVSTGECEGLNTH